ncbi:hypothetical protein ABB37_05259 [Leptomonas pyrrhocoris]|uniref:Tyrosine specific protein phosphatases domain-containing protein n=1 Tax=Leptomonas pyrrhocoris TaxID=157538 RepID=A0A0N0DUU8_LEPPY|nr:hypothetical protein ABB37_05259 [Leptomonas pyrrhocoris]KPA79414.1 hypothetical protein ABB37_05259 [Leptomonas pyrrhocoris]|eukprot:XP_015657853.1 hypothetical protein ABB37_05259 [Leptomonas pyrrhocoris]
MQSLQEDARPFTRTEEVRLHLLQYRAEHNEPLTEAEALELAHLKRRYHSFIEEGERRLREGAVLPPPKPSSVASPTSDGELDDAGVTAAFARAGRAAYFWGSLVATAVPGYVGRMAGVTTDFLHWNWVADKVVLGAIPVVTQVGSSGNHLLQLKEQLEQRHETLGLVVACLEEEELDGYGMNVIQFAKEADWRKNINADVEFVHLPMTDTTASTPLPAVAKAVMKMEECIRQRGQTVYVHCKAGKGRSWMVVMCYLTTYGGMAFAEAAEVIQEKRVQVNPSAVQKQFAEQFPFRFAQWKSLYDK